VLDELVDDVGRVFYVPNAEYRWSVKEAGETIDVVMEEVAMQIHEIKFKNKAERKHGR